MSIFCSVRCNACEKEFDTFLDRDNKNTPTTEGVPCSFCGKRVLQRIISPPSLKIPPSKGEIKRLEYSYENEDGKKFSKKVDPSVINKK